MTDDFPQIRAVVDEDALPPDVEFSVQVDQQFTETSPARLRIHCTNRAETTRQFHFGGSPPFSKPLGLHTASDAWLYAIPDDRHNIMESGKAPPLVPEMPVEGCWRASHDPGWHLPEHIRELAPDDTVSEQYTVLAAPDNDPCLPEGEYVFTGDRLLPDAPDWTFSLLVEAREGAQSDG